MSLLALIGLLVISSSTADVKHVLEGSAHPPDPQDVNHLATNPSRDFWWMQSDSPLKAAVDYYKKCNTQGQCLTPVNPSAPAPQPFRPHDPPKIDVNKNPFFNGNFKPSGGNANFNKEEHKIDVGKNPFLSGSVVTAGDGKPVIKDQNGFLGVQPSQPFGNTKKPGFATTHPLEQKKKPGFATAHPLKEGGKKQGGLLDIKVECKGQGFMCVEKSLCLNGVVNTNGEGLLQARSDVRYCHEETEICCQLNNLNGVSAGKSSVPGSTIKFAGGAGFSPGLIHVQPLNVQPEVVFGDDHGHHSSSTSKSTRDTSFSPNSVFSSTVDYSDTRFDDDVRFASTFQGPAYLPPIGPGPTTPQPKPFETRPSINQQYVPSRPSTPKYVPPSVTTPRPTQPTYRPAPSTTTYRPAPPVTFRPAPSTTYRPAPPATFKPAPPVTFRPAPSTSREYLPPRQTTPRPTTQYVPQPSVTPQRPYQPSVTPQKPYQPSVTPQKPYQPSIPTQRPYQPSVTPQRPYQPSVTPQRPYQPSVTPQPSTPSQRPYQPSVTPQKPYQPSITPYQPSIPTQPPQRPYQPSVTPQRPYQPSITPQRPYQPSPTTPRPYQPPQQPSRPTTNREYLPPRPSTPFAPQPSSPRPTPFIPQQTTPRPQPPQPRPTPPPYKPSYPAPSSPQPRPTPPPFRPTPEIPRFPSPRPSYPAPSSPQPRPSFPSYPSPSSPQPRPSFPSYPSPSSPQPRPSFPSYPSPSSPQPRPSFPSYPSPSTPQPRPSFPSYPSPSSPQPRPSFPQFPGPSTPQPRPSVPQFPSPSTPQPRPTSPQVTNGYQYPTPSSPRPNPFIPQQSTPLRPGPSITNPPYSPSTPSPTPRPRPFVPQQPTGGYEYPKPTPTFGYPTTPRQDISGSNVNSQFVPRPRPNKPQPENPDQTGDAANVDGAFIRPTTPRSQFPIEQNTAPPQGCAAALKCVQEIYCSADGVISPVPVVLTKEQELSRVPTTVCQDTESGIIGKCCRDPNYKDPWPSANLVNGVDDGQYKEDDSIAQYQPDLQRNIRSHKGGPRQDFDGTRNTNVEAAPQPTCGQRQLNTKPEGPGPLDANFAEIPWQAMILRDSNRSLLCGGVIIRRNAVLTAAHCIDGIDTNDILIKGGEWKLGIDEEPLPFQVISVAAAIRHPQYQQGSLVNDLALLVLEEKLRFTKNVGPLCLPQPNQIPAQNCVATGWGKRILQLHAKNAIMHAIDVKIMDNQQCEETLGNRFQHAVSNYSPNTLCGYSAIDQCRVDYGSALACTDGTHYTLSGIYSWDTGCKQEGQIGGYIAPDVEWIESTLAKPLEELRRIGQ